MPKKARKSGSDNMGPQLVFLAIRRKKPSTRRSNWLSELANAGFLPIVVHWKNIRFTNNGEVLVSGMKHIPGSAMPITVTNEPIVPSIIFHAFFKSEGKSAELYNRLVDTFPDAYASWSPEYRQFSYKCDLERILIDYEAVSGVRVQGMQMGNPG